ncbi:MAG: hypothetical protein GXO77_05475, partial [Calditrichaeota bacterium]|nr:hypothetical protein [Calditrichota bacterium]
MKQLIVYLTIICSFSTADFALSFTVNNPNNNIAEAKNHILLLYPKFSDPGYQITPSDLDSVERALLSWERENFTRVNRKKIFKQLGFSKVIPENKAAAITPYGKNSSSLNVISDRKLLNSLTQDNYYGYRENRYRYRYLYDSENRYKGYDCERIHISNYYSYIHWDSTSRMRVFYDENGNIIEEKYEIRKYGQWENDYRYLYDWDDFGNQILYAYQYWDDDQNDWVYDDKIEWQYDANGNEILYSTIYWFYGKIYWGYKSLKNYDEANKITEYISQYWNRDMGNWENSYRYTYEYDDTLISQKFVYDWNEDEWQLQYRYTYYYNDHNQLTKIIIDKWQDEWKLYAHYLYDYNSKRLLVKILYQTRNYDSWQNKQQYLYEYDDRDNEIYYLQQYWQDEQWNKSYESRWEYDSSNRLVMYFHKHWKDNKYVSYGYKYVYEYNVNNNQTLFISQEWQNGHWQNSGKYKSVFKDNYLKLDISYYWKNNKWNENWREYYGYELDPPMLPSFVTHPADASLSCYISVQAVGNEPFYYSLSEAPDAMEIDKNNGIIKWRFHPDTGSFKIKVKVQNDYGWTEQSFIVKLLNDFPVIQEIKDVPNDQGGKVYITFTPSVYDYKEYISQYGVWLKNDSGEWISIGSIPALGNIESYKFLAPTIGDSTKSHGQIWSYYKITAHSSRYYTNYYISPIDSGYSLDNLAPAPPSNVTIESNKNGIALM